MTCLCLEQWLGGQQTARTEQGAQSCPQDGLAGNAGCSLVNGLAERGRDKAVPPSLDALV